MCAPDPSAVASRLCQACGLCCNGVIFHTVRLQPGDSAPALTALGLRVRRKRKQDYFQQPCAAFRGRCCSIYEQRPTRCRLFECRQLRRVLAGEISETEALEHIAEVQSRVLRLEELLARSGVTNPKRALAQRVEKILAVPLLDPSDAAAAQVRADLIQAMNDLDVLLDRDFRVAADGG